MKELIIIGAGPAGLTASIYGIRAGLDLAVLEKLSPGGQVMNTYEVENYPGFPEPVAGWELMSRMEEQAKRLGAEIISGEVSSIVKGPDGIFRIMLADGSEMTSTAVISATGASFKKLGIPGEKEFTGRGVSYCATCDAAFFREKTTAVIGGGDVALEEAHFLSRFSSRVYLIHRRDAFRGTKILQERVFSCGKITPVYDTVVESINGGAKVENLSLKNVKTGGSSVLAVDGVFIFIGHDANTCYLPADVLGDNGEVLVDMKMRTPVDGLFAAGDMRVGSRRQIVNAAADGASAAMSADEYISAAARNYC